MTLSIKNKLVEFYFDECEKQLNKYNRTVLFIQVGSFYCAYQYNEKGPNLEEINKITDLLITRMDKKKELSMKNTLMIGFPMCAEMRYLDLLINNNYTVILYEQYKDKESRKIKRRLKEVVSRGTYINDEICQKKNYIISMYISKEKHRNNEKTYIIGLSAIDLSTSKNIITEIYIYDYKNNNNIKEIKTFLEIYKSTEIILIKNEEEDILIDELNIKDKIKININITINKMYKKYKDLNWQNLFFERLFKKKGMLTMMEELNLEYITYGRISYIYLLEYINEHNPILLNNLTRPKIYEDNKYMTLGNDILYQLDIKARSHNYYNKNNKIKCLFDIINETKTYMGKRKLEDYILNYPLINSSDIKNKLDKIENFINKIKKKKINIEVIRTKLGNLSDMEKLCRKLNIRKINPYTFFKIYRDCKNIINLLQQYKKENQYDKIKNFLCEIENLYNISKMKEENFKNDKSNVQINMIYKRKKKKTLSELDDNIKKNKQLLETLCEKLSTNIKDIGKAKIFNKNTDKKVYIKYTNKDGYYLITTNQRYKSLKKNLDKKKKIIINDKYEIDTDTINFINVKTPVIKIKFKLLNQISKDLIKMTQTFNDNIKESFMNDIIYFNNKYTNEIKKIIDELTDYDILQSNSYLAIKRNYCKPIIKKNSKSYVKFEGIRHPIIESISKNEYITNDLELGTERMDGIVLFGENFSGKSSLMKSIGINILMAQMGMYVAAKYCEISPYRKIIARISKHDNLFKELSSFTLEMQELKHIMENCDENTMIIGDELCSGTEYISGCIIIAATILKLAKEKTSFICTSHIHELTEIDEIKKLNNVDIYHLEVKHHKKNLIYLRKLKKGDGPKIYGLMVAENIIKDKSFLNITKNLKKKMLGDLDLFDTKLSKYNKNVVIDQCEICKIKKKKNEIPLHTHHIEFQATSPDKEFCKIKKHVKLHSEANLVILCHKCHKKVHSNKIIIKGWIETNNGRKLNYYQILN